MSTYKTVATLSIVFVSLLVTGCSGTANLPISYEQMIPEGYAPAFQSTIQATVVVLPSILPDDPFPGLFRLTAEEFEKALLKTAGPMISGQDGNPNYSLTIMNFNCAFGVGEVVKRTCAGRSYWVLRNMSSGHMVWQKHVEVSVSVGRNSLNRLEPARIGYAKEAIQKGLSALSERELVKDEKRIEELADQWRAHRNRDCFDELYKYLLFSSETRLSRIRDGYVVEMQGDLLNSITRQYVNDLVGEPDNVLSETGENQTLEWVMKGAGKEVVYRLSFYQNRLSGGSVKKQE